MMLESLCHGDNSFVTLTYSDENLPDGGNLVPKDTQDWLKRLRFAWSERCKDLDIPHRPLRYYLVGEYGDDTKRPHYHVALFGYPTCLRGRTKHPKKNQPMSCCIHCDFLYKTWGHGGVDVGDLTLHSAQYICGYVTKKMTAKGDPRLDNKHPEFARMSRRPGIGATAMQTVADALFTKHGADEVHLLGDVPNSLMHGGRKLPLGRYLKGKLRDEIGMDQTFRTQAKQAYEDEMFAMYIDAVFDKETGKRKKDFLSFKQFLVDTNHQKRTNLENRTKIFKSKRSL